MFGVNRLYYAWKYDRHSSQHRDTDRQDYAATFGPAMTSLDATIFMRRHRIEFAAIYEGMPLYRTRKGHLAIKNLINAEIGVWKERGTTSTKNDLAFLAEEGNPLASLEDHEKKIWQVKRRCS